MAKGTAKVVHIEIPADDTTRGRKFWSELFGVEFQSYDGPTEYHMFQNDDEQSGGGMMPRQEGQEGIVVYFNTDDMDATLEKVRELGGSVEAEKMPVPGMGWFAPVRDPEGNRFSFWQSDENAPVPAGMESGQASA
jgi:predicted enzyme related to lactoylglutathione lyase